MAIKYWEKDTFDLSSFDDLKVSHVSREGVLRLRQKDANDDFDPSGDFEASTADLENLRGTDLTDLFGFDAGEEFDQDADGNDLGTIRYQLSNDNGATFLYFDGAAWSVATLSTHVNDFLTVDANISTFPFANPRQIRPRVLFTPSADLKHTPRLQCLGLPHGFEDRYDFINDFKRTLKQHIDSKLRVFGRFRIELTASTGTFAMVTDYLPQAGSTAPEILGVFNLTDDPARNTNLFSGITGTSSPWTVTMTSAQDSGDLIQVEFRARVPVFVSADADLNKSQLPAIVANVTFIAEQRELRRYGGVTEVNITQESYRVRNQNLYLRPTVMFECLASREHISNALAEELARIFSFSFHDFVSLATGQRFAIMDFQPERDVDQVAGEMYNKRVVMEAIAKNPQGIVELGALIDSIKLGLGSTNQRLIQETF